MFKEICALIESLTGFVIGAKLQAGHWLQDKPERCVLISETGGATNYWPNQDVFDLTIQALARAKTYFDARSDIYAVFNALHGTNGWNLPGIGGDPDYIAMTIEAMSAPVYLGEDDNRRHLFSVNFIFRIEQGSCKESGSI